MANLVHNKPIREKLWDTLLSIFGGILGGLMANIAFPATGGIYLLLLFVLPGTLLVGGLIGFFLSQVIGRGFAMLASGGASFIIVLVLLLLFLARTLD